MGDEGRDEYRWAGPQGRLDAATEASTFARRWLGLWRQDAGSVYRARLQCPVGAVANTARAGHLFSGLQYPQRWYIARSARIDRDRGAARSPGYGPEPLRAGETRDQRCARCRHARSSECRARLSALWRRLGEGRL